MALDVTITRPNHNLTVALGPQGPTGPTGAPGAAGPGVPTGGTTNQLLTKSSATDYATAWASNLTIGTLSCGAVTSSGNISAVAGVLSGTLSVAGNITATVGIDYASPTLQKVKLGGTVIKRAQVGASYNGLEIKDGNDATNVDIRLDGSSFWKGPLTVDMATPTISLGTSGPRVMAGTGSPEGVVTAPVGSRWTRTDGAALGDLEYMKASGSGNTGWKVSYGDTGNRNLVGSVTANATATYTTVQLRRIGAQVFLTLNLANTATSVTHELLATLPVGFRPIEDHSVAIYPPNATSASQVTAVSVDSSNGQTQYRNNNAVAMAACLTWTTNDAWPASLPGT